MSVRLLLICLLAVPAVAFARADDGPFTVTILPGSAGQATPEAVTSGRLDREFTHFDFQEARGRNVPFWLRLELRRGVRVSDDAALAVRRGRHLDIRAYDAAEGAGKAIAPIATLPEYRAEQTLLYVMPAFRSAPDAIYLRVQPTGTGAERLSFSLPSLAKSLVWGREQARMIALAFGALTAMSMTALLIWFVMPSPIFVYYATLFSLQGLYIAYVSGQGFEWPVLSAALPLAPAGCALGRRCLPLRARDHRHAPLFAAQLPVLRLACDRFRGARARKLRAPARGRPVRRGRRQLDLRRHGRLHADRRVHGLASRQPAGRMVPGRLGDCSKS